MLRGIDAGGGVGYTQFMAKTLKFEGKIRIRVWKDEETGQVIAHSPDFDLTTQGDSENHAIEMFKEALELFLIECAKLGTLEQVLSELGWHEKRPYHWVPPHLLRERALRNLRIPLPA